MKKSIILYVVVIILILLSTIFNIYSNELELPQIIIDTYEDFTEGNWKNIDIKNSTGYIQLSDYWIKDFRNEGETLSWPVNQCTLLPTSGGILTVEFSGSDPNFTIDSGLNLAATNYYRVDIKMKVDETVAGSGFVIRPNNDFSAGCASGSSLTKDGEYHIYHFDVANYENWTNQVTITKLRIDPVDMGAASGDKVYIDYIKILKNGYMQNGYYLSKIFNFSELNGSGIISWEGITPPSTAISVLSRTGSSLDTNSFSTWSTNSNNKFVASSSNKYIQLKILLSGDGNTQTPELDWIKIVPLQLVSEIKLSDPAPTQKEIISFSVIFKEEMDTTVTPILKLRKKGEEYYTINVTANSLSEQWENNKNWVVSFNLTTLRDGIYDIELSGAKRSSDNRTTFPYRRDNFLVVDLHKYVSKEKIEWFPNPFSPNRDGKLDNTNLIFNLSSPANVSVNIYTIRGRLVKSLLTDAEKSGTVVIEWDGTDNNGDLVNIGAYLSEIIIGSNRYVKKIFVVK